MIAEIEQKKVLSMNTNTKIAASVYVAISSFTVLVMLNTSFEQFGEKYLPSFLAAQKFALPIILSAMSVGYLVFFEPERLQKKGSVRFLNVLLMLTIILYSYYLTTVDVTATGIGTIVLFLLQWIATIGMTIYSFFLRSKE